MSFDKLIGLAVEDEPKRPLVIVLDEKNHRSVENRLEKQRRRHEQFAPIAHRGTRSSGRLVTVCPCLCRLCFFTITLMEASGRER
jgi:hypothetical protein